MGAGAGAALILATVAVAGCGNDRCGSLTEPLLVAAVELTPPAATLRVGQSRQLSAIPLTQCQHPVAGAAIAWTTDNPAVVSVSPAGMITALARGSATVTATAEGKAAQSTILVTLVPVADLSIDPNPASVEVGQDLALNVEVTDSAGNVLVGRPVLWSSSDTTVATVTDDGIVRGRTAGAVEITATADTVDAVAAVTVTAPPPASLAFVAEPSDLTAGETLAPAVRVAVVDRFGIPVAGDTTPVTLSLAVNPGGAALSGTTTVRASDGVATFTNLTLVVAGAGYTLIATAPGLPNALSQPFAVAPAAAAALEFSVQPNDGQAGNALSPAIEVRIVDAFDNTVTTSTATVGITIKSNPAGSTLGGMTHADAVLGVATFASLFLDRVGAGYTLEATASGLGARESQSFSVTPGPAAALAFTVEPTSTGVNEAIAPPIEVTVFDAFGNQVTANSTLVSIELASNPGGAILAGRRTKAAFGGVAIFDDLSLDQPGNGYRLRATAAGLSAALSATFNVQ